ncbi:hypothetical protein PG993_012514 [Apiospora rasikravindrae]|uniref:Heterokaryon incompatibility domain-containing protein n=1 Tax=Apiospora rasikravindrae TaxID=990691 RepID=A0ABR1S2T7_9PEZI
MNMDSIYENAALTIISATGNDPSKGLPGVSSHRITKEDPYRHQNSLVTWIPPPPYAGITKSRWSTRGWTYQEATLSRRRQVFTEHQVYFECRSGARCEGLRLPLQASSEGADKSSDRHAFRLPNLFSIPLLDSSGSAPSHHPATGPIINAQLVPDKPTTFNAYTHCAERFSQRTLSFDSDSLNAFGGMIKRFESLERGPVRHLWGSPFFDPHDDYSPGDIVDYAGFFLAGLSWRHVTTTTATTAPPAPAPRTKSAKQPPRPALPRRRKKFPSWSWTGWEGAATWPRVTTPSEVRARDPDAGLASFRLSFEGGSTRSLPDPDPEEVRLIQQARAGYLKALRLGSIGVAGFLLVVKRKGRSYYRVGLMQVRSAVITEGVHDQDVRVFKLK